MCSKGTREHNHPERPLANTLFRIKPIACKHRLLKKQQKMKANTVNTTQTQFSARKPHPKKKKIANSN